MAADFAGAPLKFIDEKIKEFMCSANSSFPRVKEEGIPNISFKNSLIGVKRFLLSWGGLNDGFHVTKSYLNADLSHVEGNTRCGDNCFPYSHS